MQVFKVGKATVTRIEETYQAIYPIADIFPDFSEVGPQGAWPLAGAGPLRNCQQEDQAQCP